ncbi:hypothetical protein FSP39_020969 [Pinctada imbricata]|uniref:Uncharacterized protein n=1 Tax=Pinctada imbricata TaxID=66713 RepID=A0AA88XL37_PINIB|nr:hypothetical protein FSP39_020969 [Pinctada imbricata]
MRENLLFFGIPEEEEEDCDIVLIDFLTDTMKIRTDISFERIHRVGRKHAPRDGQRQRPRPIVAKFSFFKDRELVRSQAPWTLKGSNYWVKEQFPVEIEQRRKALYPIMKEERRKKNKVKLVRDRLFINGFEYIPPAQRAGPTGASGRGTPSQQERKRARTGYR